MESVTRRSQKLTDRAVALVGKVMRAVSHGFSLMVLALVLGALGVFAVNDDLRYKAERTLVEVPGMVTYFAVRGGVVSRDFLSTAAQLNRHLSWSLNFGPPPNVLTPSLIATTEYVIDELRLPQEYAALTPFLERLAKENPDLFRPNIWYARAIADTHPKMALAHLEAARKLIPADPRTYRIAMRAARALNDNEVKATWCGKYRSAHLGGTRQHDSNTLFVSTGVRKLALEATTRDGHIVLVENHGVELGAFRNYTFSFPENVDPSMLRIHTGNVPGLSMEIEKIRLSGLGVYRELAFENLAVLMEKGFVDARRRKLLLASADDTVEFHLPVDGLEGIHQIEMKAKIERMDLGIVPECGKP